MVLHAIGMCPICTYRTGRRTRFIPRSLDHLHDAVAAYASATLRLRAYGKGAAPSPYPSLSSSASSSQENALPVALSSVTECEDAVLRDGNVGGDGCGSSVSGSPASSGASNDWHGRSSGNLNCISPPPPPPQAPTVTTTTTTTITNATTNIPGPPTKDSQHSTMLLAAKATAHARLLASMTAFAAELPALDLAEVSDALFAVMLELMQTLEAEGLLVLAYSEPAGGGEGGGEGKGEGEWRVEEKGSEKGKREGKELSGRKTEVPFTKHMSHRVEAVKMALAARKGWYLDETVEKFERQGREVVRKMVGATLRCVERGERVVLGDDGGRRFWAEGEMGEVKWEVGE